MCVIRGAHCNCSAARAGATTTLTAPLSSAGKLDPFSTEFQSLVTDKGAMILHMLRWVMGEDKYNKTMREFAEKGIGQVKDAYSKMKTAAEEATGILENTYTNASKGASDYGLKVIEAARVNTNAAFDFAGELITAKTLSEVIELSSAHARKQFEALTEQGKELSALAQKVATETVEPIKSGMNRAFSKVA